MGRTKDYVGYIDYISKDKKTFVVKTQNKEILCSVSEYDNKEYHLYDIICCNYINSIKVGNLKIFSTDDFFRVAYLATEEEVEVTEETVEVRDPSQPLTYEQLKRLL